MSDTYTQAYQQITATIKTFNRPETLRLTLESLVPYPFYQILVADDGDKTEEIQELYSEYSKKLNLKVIELPFDSGLSAGRNALVQACKTEYFLLLDDDFSIPANIHDLHTILESDKAIGGVATYLHEYGKIRCDATNIRIREKHVVLDISTPSQAYETSAITYYKYDFIPNCTLFRTQCLRDQGWDDNIKIGTEHIDFYLAHQVLSKWEFAVTPDVIIDHFPKASNNAYNDGFRLSRKRLGEAGRYFNNKWDVRNVIHGKRHLKNPWLTGRVRDHASHFMLKTSLPSSRISKLERRIHKTIKKLVS